jgi:hypothetical protein
MQAHRQPERQGIAVQEVFHEDGSAPGNAAKYNACSARVGPGDMVSASFSGFGDIGQAGNGALLPLVAQNSRYVRCLTAYNQIADESHLEESVGFREYDDGDVQSEPSRAGVHQLS